MFEGPLQDLIDEFGRLPGIGPKSAQRIAFHLVKADPEDLARLSAALDAVRGGVDFCRVCGNISAGELCNYCGDTRRDATVICVVEEARDIQAIERTGEYLGRYHVLGGALDPLGGIGPNQLNVRLLLQRIGGVIEDQPEVSEVIIATDPNTEGEATASYLGRLLKDFPDLRVTRLASGMPLGGDLEFVDELTLSRALQGRLVI